MNLFSPALIIFFTSLNVIYRATLPYFIYSSASKSSRLSAAARAEKLTKLSTYPLSGDFFFMGIWLLIY